LLTALRRGKHYKQHPGDAVELLKSAFEATDQPDAHSSGRRLQADGYVKFVQDANAPGRRLLRLTDSGIGLADNLIEENRERTWRERLSDVPRSDWIALGALIVSLVALFRGG